MGVGGGGSSKSISAIRVQPCDDLRCPRAIHALTLLWQDGISGGDSDSVIAITCNYTDQQAV